MESPKRTAIMVFVIAIGFGVLALLQPTVSADPATLNNVLLVVPPIIFIAIGLIWVLDKVQVMSASSYELVNKDAGILRWKRNTLLDTLKIIVFFAAVLFGYSWYVTGALQSAPEAFIALLVFLRSSGIGYAALAITFFGSALRRYLQARRVRGREA